MELLTVKKDRDNLKFKAKRIGRSWNPDRYIKIIKNKDFNNLAFLFLDLYTMGYPIEKAYFKFKHLLNESEEDQPDLFFLK